MTMRASDAPRTIYTRNGVTHLLHEGLTFRPPRGETKLDTGREAKVVQAAPGANKKKRVEVSQKVGGKVRTEVWVQGTVPVHHRATA
jgi:hypothetical protein